MKIFVFKFFTENEWEKTIQIPHRIQLVVEEDEALARTVIEEQYPEFINDLQLCEIEECEIQKGKVHDIEM